MKKSNKKTIFKAFTILSVYIIILKGSKEEYKEGVQVL